MHLCAHRVKTQTLSTAADAQAYWGTDNNIYLLNLTRAFPPESPSFSKHLLPDSYSIFRRFLRPELLQRLKEEGVCAPLSCDALSGWGIASQVGRHTFVLRLCVFVGILVCVCILG